MQLACHFAHPSYHSYDSYRTHVFKQKCSTRKWQYNLHNIPKLNVQQMPTTYPSDGEAKHLRRRKNVHRVFTNTAQVTVKHRQNTNYWTFPQKTSRNTKFYIKCYEAQRKCSGYSWCVRTLSDSHLSTICNQNERTMPTHLIYSNEALPNTK